MSLAKYLLLVVRAVLLSTIVVGCGVADPSDPRTMPGGNAHTISLVTADEPGQPLTLYGTVLDNVSNQPIPGARVYLYHADANGEYLPTDPADESTAKLSGEIVTGDAGQFTVHTIVPRDYDQSGNQHIHLHYVRADGYQEIGRVILFKHDVNDAVRQWANDTGFGIVIELTERDGVMEGNVTLPLTPDV